eukprot:CAMPEP_0113888992 /NCGR_PEP_ID=MMETSP0780_2-20120614/13211_1 /TAXON_ID=652834 /ORGANISM="Palpitomonas bilix" /LENGTH=32 /DNA_ID=CAMNT_0000877965 /DNA_START=124 /DNA_END=222 /DNA_ORIENTATION=+ /assembly_acc=CAM_ASM_000599
MEVEEDAAAFLSLFSFRSKGVRLSVSPLSTEG